MSARTIATKRVLRLRPSRQHLRRMFHLAALRIAVAHWRIPLALS